MTLRGQHFGDGTKASGVVMFGSVAAVDYASWSDTEIEVTVPIFAMPIAETAEALGISTATVERNWRFARAWLKAKLLSDGSA